MFRPSRNTPAGHDRFLDLKIALFLAGAALGIVGMVRENQNLIVAGLVIVAAGILLRIITSRRSKDEPPPPTE